MAKPIDLTGQRFGRLTVVCRAKKPSPFTEYTGAYWLCKCDCGVERIVRSIDLRNGQTCSCGCYMREQVAAANRARKHIKWEDAEYERKAE